jgi:hypothetical protein
LEFVRFFDGVEGAFLDDGGVKGVYGISINPEEIFKVRVHGLEGLDTEVGRGDDEVAEGFFRRGGEVVEALVGFFRGDAYGEVRSGDGDESVVAGGVGVGDGAGEGGGFDEVATFRDDAFLGEDGFKGDVGVRDEVVGDEAL